MESKSSHLDEIKHLNHILDNLDTIKDVEYYLYESIQLSITSPQNNLYHEKALNYIKHNIIICNDSLYQVKITEYLFLWFKKFGPDSIENYFSDLSTCLDHLGFSIYTNDNFLKSSILNNMLEKFQGNSLSVFTHLNNQNIKYQDSSLNHVQKIGIFRDVCFKYSPKHVSKLVKLDNFNLFLTSISDEYVKENEFINQWITFFIESGENLDFIPFYNFYKKHQIPQLKSYYLNNSNNEFLKHIVLKDISIKNYSIKDNKIEDAKDLKNIVKSFYGTDSKKLVSLVSKCCQKNGSFDFAYLYLGQILSMKDINHVHTFLDDCLLNNTEVNLARSFIDSEIDALTQLNSYTPNNLIKFFKNIDFNQYYSLIYRSKNYLNKFKYVQAQKTWQEVVAQINLEVSFLKESGFKITYKEDLIKLNQKSFMNYTLILPQSDKEIFVWGQVLDNCLIYPEWAHKVYEGKITLLGLFSGELLEMVCEIDNDYNIKMIEGFSRSKPSQTLQEKLQHFLKIIKNLDLLKLSQSLE